MRIVNDRLNGLLITEDTSTFQSRNCTSRRLYSVPACPPLVSSITAFWKLTRGSLPKFTTSNWIKCTFIYVKSGRHWLIDEDQFCFMTMLGHILPGKPWRISPTLDPTHCHRHHISLISLTLTSFLKSNDNVLSQKTLRLN